MSKKRIMVVDDEPHIRLLVHDILTQSREYTLIEAASGEACLRKLDEAGADLVLLDYQLGGMDGKATLREIKQRYPDLPVVIMTAHGTIERAVDTMRLGSYDFITKPFTAERLRTTVRNALLAWGMRKEAQGERAEPKERFRFDQIIGESPVMQEVFRAVEKVIDSDVTVLVQGESGTGKELIARAIHHHSKTRKDKPFVAVNCTALPEALLESELFGHEKGAFTGAVSRRIGKFELADGGTVFLDEIGDMSQVIQAKILRVLQEREFERLGGNQRVRVNIRLISATNKNLWELVQKGIFREDLFYRISVYPIKLPPLRDRRGDIPLLAAHFMKRYAMREKKPLEGIHPEALKILMGYHWPGNVRELENTIERAVVLTSGPLIQVNDLPSHIIAVSEERPNLSDETLPQWIERLEIEMLKKTLLEYEGNISKAAKKLGIGRATIYRKAKKYNLPFTQIGP